MCFSFYIYSMKATSTIPATSSSKSTTIKASEAFNRCGIRNDLLYLPAFKPKHERTIDNVIPHWTNGLKSFFSTPKNLTYEWFSQLVSEINEIDIENGGNSSTRFVTRDGDSFIENVLIPNVDQICQNVCVPRGNLDGSLVEMFMAGANMVTSEPVMKKWKTLIRETVMKCTCTTSNNEKKEEDECLEDPTCDCEMCNFYQDNDYDSYSQSTATTDCSGDPICHSDTDSD